MMSLGMLAPTRTRAQTGAGRCRPMGLSVAARGAFLQLRQHLIEREAAGLLPWRMPAPAVPVPSARRPRRQPRRHPAACHSVIVRSSCLASSVIRNVAADAAESDVAHAGIHHLRVARRRAVAPAVAWRAEERAALHHLPRDAD